jgi:hypothetical protein
MPNPTMKPIVDKFKNNRIQGLGLGKASPCTTMASTPAYGRRAMGCQAVHASGYNRADPLS